MEVARAATEECGRMGGVGSNGPDLVGGPDPVRVSPSDAVCAFGRACECLACLGVTDLS